MKLYYSKVLTRYGNSIHLTQVPTKYREPKIEGLPTLCGLKAYHKADAYSDSVDCKRCLKVSAQDPKPLR